MARVEWTDRTEWAGSGGSGGERDGDARPRAPSLPPLPWPRKERELKQRQRFYCERTGGRAGAPIELPEGGGRGQDR